MRVCILFEIPDSIENRRSQRTSSYIMPYIFAGIKAEDPCNQKKWYTIRNSTLSHVQRAHFNHEQHLHLSLVDESFL